MTGDVAASAPIVRIPVAANRSLVTGPTPHSSSTGSGSRNARSRPGATTTTPSGLATCDATLARCLVVATPTETGKPSSTRTRRRISSAISAGRAEQMYGTRHVEERFVDRDAFHQRGEVAENVDHLVAESLVLTEMPVDERQTGAQPRARRPGIPPCTPNALAS